MIVRPTRCQVHEPASFATSEKGKPMRLIGTLGDIKNTNEDEPKQTDIDTDNIKSMTIRRQPLIFYVSELVEVPSPQESIIIFKIRRHVYFMFRHLLPIVVPIP